MTFSDAGRSEAIAAQIMLIIGSHARLTNWATTPWASANFAGHRHRLLLTRDTPLDRRSERRLSAAIADHEFDIGEAVVADAHLTRVSPDGRTIAVELLTVLS